MINIWWLIAALLIGIVLACAFNLEYEKLKEDRDAKEKWIKCLEARINFYKAMQGNSYSGAPVEVCVKEKFHRSEFRYFDDEEAILFIKEKLCKELASYGLENGYIRVLETTPTDDPLCIELTAGIKVVPYD